MSAITSRKGNPISRRTLRFLLVCKVIGSPSRSRFAREFNILQIRAGNITLGETRFCNYKMPGPPFRGHRQLPSYRVFTYRSRYRVAFPSPISRLDLYTGGANKQTVHICREILLPMAETPRNVREDKSRLYRRSLITLALRREISFR